MTVLVKYADMGDFAAIVDDVNPAYGPASGGEQSGTSTPAGVDVARLCREDPDVALMLEVQSGSTLAFRQLVDRWQRPLISFFYRSTHSFEEAEDLAQATFIRIYRAAAGYQPRARFAGYIFQVARRLLLNEVRRRRRKPSEPLDPIDFDRHTTDSCDSRDREIMAAFDEALIQLPENHRSALLLYVQQGLSYEEIAATLETGVPAVKTWIYRGRQQLRTLLSDYFSQR